MRPIPTPFTRALVAALTVASGGCAEIGRIASSAVEKPTLSFEAAELREVGFDAATVGFRFQLHNPNPFGVSLARLGYSVKISDAQLATGELPGGLDVPASGAAPVVFPVRVRYADVPGILGLFQKREKLPYALAGHAGVNTPAGVLDVPLSHSGTLPIPELPTFSLEGLGLDASSASPGVRLRLNVKNPNAFTIPGGELSYAVSLAGRQVATAQGKALERVPANGSASLVLPIQLDLGGVARAASALAQGGMVDVGLRGTASLAGIPIPLDLATRVPLR